jgi:hypothetical protein
MVISVEDKDLRRQEFSTSCWISTAQFLLQYMKVDVPLAELQTRYYNPDPDSASLMSGAGKPTQILKDYSSKSGRIPETLSVKPEEPNNRTEVVKAIAGSIKAGVPVIALIKSQQVQGFGHALVITAIEEDTGTIGFKDPATGTSPRPFAVDVRTVPYEELVRGFAYRYANSMQQNVFAYCTRIIYLRPAPK